MLSPARCRTDLTREAAQAIFGSRELAQNTYVGLLVWNTERYCTLSDLHSCLDTFFGSVALRHGGFAIRWNREIVFVSTEITRRTRKHVILAIQSYRTRERLACTNNNCSSAIKNCSLGHPNYIDLYGGIQFRTISEFFCPAFVPRLSRVCPTLSHFCPKFVPSLSRSWLLALDHGSPW
jgi:hypothetical protein